MINNWLKSFGTLINKEESDGVTHYEFDFDGSPVHIWTSDEMIKLEYKYNNLEDEFLKYCESLDDDIFVEACERFNDYKPIREFSKNINSKDIKIFKNIVEKIVCNKIDYYKEMIEK